MPVPVSPVTRAGGLGPSDGLGVVLVAVHVVEAGLPAAVLGVPVLVIGEVGLAGHLPEHNRDVAALDVLVGAEQVGAVEAGHPAVVRGGVDVLGEPLVVGDVEEDAIVGDVELRGELDLVVVVIRVVGDDHLVPTGLDAFVDADVLAAALGELLLVLHLVGLSRQGLPVLGVGVLTPLDVVLEGRDDGPRRSKRR